jgi:integrase
VRWHMVPHNVCETVKAPRPAYKEMRALSAEESRRLLEAARSDRLEALYVLAVHIGMRQGELLALKWSDVDLENATISVRRTITKSGTRLLLGEPKTKKSRRTTPYRSGYGSPQRSPATPDGGNGALGRPLRRSRPRLHHGSRQPHQSHEPRKRSFAALLKRAELPLVRFHDLRHTCATLLFSRGVHPKYVQELLGHANISITLDRYSHVIPGMGDHTARAMEDALS